jgi:DNA (cytosine-5)-methyltransferase 1
MRHMDLFSGIGGFALAASWVWGNEHEIVTFCEKEEFPRQVLKKHWPDVPCNTDIFTLNGGEYGTIDLVTGGFPCQPYSTAGKRRGAEDDRALWPEMFRVVKEAKPRIIIGENVANFANMGLDSAIFDLESAGYEIGTYIIPACAVDAKHRRDRIWIVAYHNKDNVPAYRAEDKLWQVPIHSEEWDFRNINSARSIGTLRAMSYHRILRELHGIPRRVDRLGALGNAIVPQVAAVIMAAIKDVDRIYNNAHVAKPKGTAR